MTRANIDAQYYNNCLRVPQVRSSIARGCTGMYTVIAWEENLILAQLALIAQRGVIKCGM